MKIPNEKTFKVLEERKKYLLRSQTKDTKNGYVNAEIEALNRIMDFTKLVLHNVPDEVMEKTIYQHELNAKNNTVEESNEEKEYTILYQYEKEITKFYKISISFINQNGNTFILFEPQKYMKEKYRWENHGKYRITSEVLNDVVKKANEMEIVTPSPHAAS